MCDTNDFSLSLSLCLNEMNIEYSENKEKIASLDLNDIGIENHRQTIPVFERKVC